MEPKKKVIGILVGGFLCGALMSVGFYWNRQASFVVNTTMWGQNFIKVTLEPHTDYKLLLKRIEDKENATGEPSNRLRVYKEGDKILLDTNRTDPFRMGKTYDWEFSTDLGGEYKVAVYHWGVLCQMEPYSKFRVKIREITATMEDLFVLGGGVDILLTVVAIYLVRENRNPIVQEKARIQSKEYREKFIETYEEEECDAKWR